jgi:hypothetical protein
MDPRRGIVSCTGRNAVVWLRKISDEVAKNCDCSALEHVLATIPGAKRMIMGHTIHFQEVGINAEVSHLRPVLPVSDAPHQWWRYAAQAALQQKQMW